MDEELLSTLFEALANLNQQQKDLTDELNGFEGEYSKDKVVITKQIDDIAVQIDRLVKEAVGAISKPKDGEDGKNGVDAIVDYDLLKEFILKAVDELPKAVDGKDGLSGQDGRNGAKGLDGHNGQDGDDGADGKQGIRGLKGSDGEDGIGITDVKELNGQLFITLTNGVEKSFYLPKQKALGGGGYTPDNFSYDLIDKTTLIPYNQQMIVMGGIDIILDLNIDGKLILEQ